MGDWIAIVNRRADGGRDQESVLDIVRSFADTVAFTAYPGHATDLARRAGGFRGLIVVGGDGTLREVLNGIDLRRQTLAIVPTGRGNSLARDLGLYPAARGLRALASGRTLAIDLMEVGFEDAAGGLHRSLSASIVAVGYPAAVTAGAAGRFLFLGRYGYAAAAAFLPPVKTAMYISGDAACAQLTGFIASNTQHLANFMALPRASCRDGLFDVMELRATYFAQLAHNLSALSSLGFYNPVEPRQTAEISVRLERPQPLMIDGELHPDVAAFQIRLLPSAAAFHVRTPK
jgi:diacylglycerol kinase family enzyme